MKKSYQLAGYTLHVIPSKKFKNITMSLKLEGKLTKENVTKRSLLAFNAYWRNRKLSLNLSIINSFGRSLWNEFWH